MLGRNALAVVAVLTILAVPMDAAGSESHRDYDSAELDLTVLQAYVESAIAHLEASLRAGASGDFASASNRSDSFSDKVGRAHETLSRIPPEADSYPYLDRYVWSLDRAGRNLSTVMKGLEDQAIHGEWLSTFSASEWTIASLSENLTGLDRAVTAMKMLKGKVLPACKGLDSDIRELMVSGLSLHDPLSDLDVVTGYAEDLPEDVPLDPYIRVLFDPLFDEWAADLSSISLENDPPQRLGGMVDVLSLAIIDLSQGLEGLILSGVRVMVNASELDMQVRSQQKDLLSVLSELDGEIARGGGMSVKLGLLRDAEDTLLDLDGSLAAERSLLSSIVIYDDGGVDRSLSDLERLVESYHDRLEGLDLVFTELSDLSSLLCRIVRSNLIGPDQNRDGHISDDEARNLTMPGDVEALLDEASSLLGYIEGVISTMDPRTGSPYSDAFEGLATFMGHSSGLCSSHGSFLEDVKAYLDPTRSGDMHLIEAIHDLAAMEGSMAGLSASMGTIEASGLETDPGSLVDLESQISLYEDLVIRLVDASDLDTSLTISIDRRSAPYDSLLVYRIFAVERRVDGRIHFLDGVDVEVGLDDGPLGNSTLSGGKASGSISILRDYSLGPHALSASLMLSNGTTLKSSASFEVRKLRTYIGCDPEGLSLEPSEPGDVAVWVLDELSRPVIGRVSLMGNGNAVEGEGVMTFTYATTGIFEEDLIYEGDQWYQGSNRTIVANVTLGPILSLSPDMTVVMMGAEFSLSWNITLGDGDLTLMIGVSSIPLGRQMNGSGGISRIDSTILGIGLHEAYLVLRSLSHWCRDGRSPSSTVLVLSVDEYGEWMNRTHPGGDGPDQPPDDEGEVPDQRPIEPLVPPREGRDPWDFLPDGWVKEIVRRFGLPILVLAFAGFLAISAFVIARRRRREEKGLAPLVPTAVEVEGAKFYPEVRRRPRKGPRDRMVSAYYDVVDATPGAGSHMTPREVSSHLETKGSKDGRGIMLSFESGLYSREGATVVDPVISGLKRLREWISSTLRGGSP